MYEKQGCSTCHSVDGTPKIGPTWKGLFGKEESFTNGSKQAVDEKLRARIDRRPQRQDRPGLRALDADLSRQAQQDRELDGIIAYIKSLAEELPWPLSSTHR